MNNVSMANLRLLLERVVKKYSALNGKPYDFGTKELLYPAEIHFIEAVGNNAAATVTGIASLFEVTKGATSQIAGKLEKRGYITRARNTDYSKEFIIALTPKGQTAYANHEKLHGMMEKSLAMHLKNEDPQSLEIFFRTIKLLENHLDEWIEKLE